MSKIKNLMDLGRAAGYSDWNKVIEIQKRIDEEEGEKDDRYITYAQAYYNLKNTEQALHFCHKTLEVNESSFEASKMLTNIYFTLEDLPKTVYFASQAIKNHKNDVINNSLNMTRFLFFFLKPFNIIPKFRKFEQKVKNDFYRQKVQGDKWINWAIAYINDNESNQHTAET